MEQRPKKALGQHWLTDRPSLEAIADAADIKYGEVVLEIGPGTGSLTEVLLKRGAKVVAVEKDTSLTETLKTKFRELPFTLNLLSISDFDLSSLPAGYKVVANIPYYLTNHLLRMLSETQHMPNSAILLVQKEVAQRVAAEPGGLSILGVTVQYYWHVNLGPIVKAELFTPPPKVDSQVLILNQRNQPVYDDLKAKELFKLVKIGFANKRKTLQNNLAAGLKLAKAEVADRLASVGLNINVRAQDLSLDDWHELAKTIND